MFFDIPVTWNGGWRLVVAGYCFFAALPANAQTADAVTSATPTAPVSAAPERAPDQFPINAIDVSGITKLDTAEVERIIYKYTGPNKTNVDVEAARKALQDAYASKGYESVLVESPVQQRDAFDAGVITLVVNEAPVANVAVLGSKHHSAAVVRRQLSAIKEGEPLNFKRLQSQFENAGRFPDRRVDFSPKPGAKEGTIDIDLTVKDKLPLHGSLELTNDNSPSTKPLRLNGAARYTDIWGLGHTLALSFVTAPERISDSLVVAGSYTAPILGSPWTLSLSGYRSNSNIAALGGTNVLGTGYQIGIRAAYRLPTAKTIQTITFGPDFKNFNQDILVSSITTGSTPIRYVPLTLTYSVAGADTESKFAKKVGESTFGATIGVTAGLRAIKRQVCIDTSNGQSLLVDTAQCVAGLPGRQFDDQFRNNAVFSSENFVHFNLGFDYALATKSDVLISTAVQAQFSDSHLITNEQFAAGGRGTVRGYFQSEAVGDQGFTGALEIAAPSLAAHLGKSVDELRLYAFADGAVVNTLGASKGVKATESLFSVGAGARARLLNHLSGEVIVGVPVIAGSVSKAFDPRTIFVVRGEF